jgi:TetR/AcrR family transcriptional regulator, transcriptional repressor of aconitase
MSTLRMTGDLRRQLILAAAKRCFARYGFAGTTTKSIAAAASISEGLLFKHFPTKSALYAEILAEECEADPALHRLLELEPSTETLVVLIREMVRHFQHIPDAPDQKEAQRLRLMVTSQLDDGEFARLIYEKIGNLIAPVFTASLERAIEAGDASRLGREPLNLFWFAHHTVLMVALARLPSVPCLSYGNAADLERQVCEFILRGIGLNDTALTSCLDQPVSAESA